MFKKFTFLGGPAVLPSAHERLTSVKKLLLILLALLAGVVFPVQGRINSALGAQTGDPVLAAAASFAGGVVLMAAVCGLLPAARAALTRVPAALRAGDVRPWHLCVGAVGALVVFTQALTIGLVGVAVFIVALIVGQLLGSILLDALGLSPAGRKPLTMVRGAAALLTLAAISLIMVPAITGEGFGIAWIASTALALAAGLLNAGQQVINARQSAAYRSPAPVTLINFTAGTLTLLAVLGALAVVRGELPRLAALPALTAPENWWYYLGGPLGCLLIAVSAVLVSRVGALAAGIGITSGHLLGSVAVDLIAPAEGVQVTGWTLAGVMLALGASLMIGLSGQRREAHHR